jgi:WD40 repeat protein
MGARYDVFLSYNHADTAAVEELYGRLRAQGLEPWLDSSELPFGTPWPPEAEKALSEQCASCAVFIGPNGLGAWQEPEMRLAHERQIETRRNNGSFPVIPVLLPGGDAKTIPGFLKANNWVAFPTLDDQDAFDDLVRAVRGLSRRIKPPPGSDGQCPYRGLEFFDVGHAPYFYGREKLIELLIERLRSNFQTKGARRFLAIIGASGSGKSSLARAGLMAKLQRGAIAGSDQWPVVICRPAGDPCASVALELAKTGGLDLNGQAAFKDRLKDRMPREASALHESVRLVLQTDDPQKRLLLLVDQFEELFTICHEESLRKAFVDNLIHAAQVSQGQTVVLLAMRADFYGKCAPHRDLARALSECQELIGPMAEDELREVIEKPAEKVGCELEPGLTDLLIKDVINDPGSLPFLQFALKELWNRRTGRKLTIEAYREIGGVTGALQRKADQVYASLNPSQQQICRRIFLRLTQPGEGTEDTKRRVPMSELKPQAGSPAEVEAVLLDLSESETRLLTGETEAGQEFFEVAHEALIRGWPELRKWIDADRQALLTRSRLTEAANDWSQKDKNTGYLYSGARLAAAAEWAKEHSEEINPLENEFINASQRQVRAGRFQILASVAILLVFGFAGVSWQWIEAVNQAEKARTAQSVAETQKVVAQRRLAENYLDRGLRLCEEGEERQGLLSLIRGLDVLPAAESTGAEEPSNVDNGARDASPDSEHAIRANLGAWLPNITALRTLLRHQGSVKHVAFSPDGKTILTGSSDHTGRLWDAATGRPIGAPLQHQDSVDAVAFSPDDKTVLTGSKDETARLWDAVTAKPIGTPLEHRAPVRAVAFSPDGTRVLTGSDDHTARLWDTATGKPTGAILEHQHRVNAVAFSPDSKTVLTGSGDPLEHKGEARLWDSATGQAVSTPLEHQGSVDVVAFSPDGKTVLTGSSDKTARLWNVATGAPIGASLRHGFAVKALAFGPDGKTVLTGSGDRTARLWDATTGKAIGAPLLHQGSVTAVAFSPDGRTVFTGSGDIEGESKGEARLWNAATGKPIGAPLTHQGSIMAVAFGPEGDVVVTTSSDNTARLWDAATGTPVGAPLPHQGSVTAVAFSHDGKTALTASWDNTARLWNVATCTQIGAVLAHRGPVTAVAFSPDGNSVLTGSDDRTARLWETATGKPIGAPLEHQNPVKVVGFSPDGKTLLTGSGDTPEHKGEARIWDAATGRQIGRRGQHRDSVAVVAFSPDGTRVLTGSDDHTARLWDTATGTPIALALKNQDKVTAAAFSPDGRIFITASGDAGALDGHKGEARLWDAATGKPIGAPLPHQGSVTTVAFSPDSKTVLTASSDNTARLWDAATGTPIALPLKHRGKVAAVAFSPDAKTVLTGSGDFLESKGEARLWDAATGKPIGAPLRHQGSVTAVAFSPDGKTALTASSDGSARLWDAGTGKPIGAPLQHRDKVTSVTFSPDGRLLLTASDDHNARLWPVFAPINGKPSQIGCWLPLITGTDLDEGGAVRVLSTDDWVRRRHQLDTWGGTPVAPTAPLDWHVEQSAECEFEQQWFAAAFHLKHVIAGKPADAALRLRRAGVLVRQKKWQDAASEFGHAYNLAPSSPTLRSLGSAQLGAEEDSAFSDTCRKLFERDANSDDSESRDEVAWLTVQSAAATTDWAGYLSLARNNCTKNPSEPEYLKTLGAVLFRAGHSPEAATELHRALESSGKGGTWSMHLFLALVEGDLNNDENTKEHLRSAEETFKELNAPDWEERVRFSHLHSEAVRLLADRTPVQAQRPQAKP